MSLAYLCDTNGCDGKQIVRDADLPKGWTSVNVEEAGATKSQNTKKNYHLCPSCASGFRQQRNALSGG